MNAVASLNLSTHDDGVASISAFPLALDWLSIALPPQPHSIPQQLQSQNPFLLPSFNPSDPLTNKQAASSFVRHIHPYASREVFAPCFRVATRFILGRVLGSLHLPAELALPHLASDHTADARFVLDLHTGSIVQIRHYPATKSILCIAHAAKRAEFLSLPPLQYARVEITYRSAHPSAAPPPAPQPDFAELLEDLPRPHITQPSWQYFCHNYTSIFPTGPLTATVNSDPGPTAPSFKNETISVSVNDPYAMSFSNPHSFSRPGGNQARRIAPKRLLPRPTP